MLGDEKVFELKWNSPTCKHCEGRGKNCRLNNMGNSSVRQKGGGSREWGLNSRKWWLWCGQSDGEHI
jgi:hypothetical protein